jgi:hypothetical protein
MHKLLTDAEVDALPAGREFDAVIAERAMGMRPAGERMMGWSDDAQWEPLPKYSTEIAAAWLLLEKFNLNVWQNQKPEFDQFNGGRWNANYWDQFPYALGKADTAPMAICRAALKIAERRTGILRARSGIIGFPPTSGTCPAPMPNLGSRP